MNPYLLIIFLCLLVILSYSFNLISKYLKIPSVLLLMLSGTGISWLMTHFEVEVPVLDTPLKVLGIIGLMVIVLEGALDLRMAKHQFKTLVNAFLSALLILVCTTFLIATIFHFTLSGSLYQSILYAVPLSVVSSAIVIPSVNSLLQRKKDFMVCESTFSDILGIMLFDFLIFQPDPGQAYWSAISLNIIISIVVSLVLSYVLVFFFHKITSKIKLFLFLSILALLFAIGKYMHYSALLIILVFGVILNNSEFFFRSMLKKYINHNVISSIRDEFRQITEESSFLIRTFFFIVFGMSLHLAELADIKIIILGSLVMFVVYFVRGISLKLFAKSSIMPEVLIAPRGLVTILLFYRIPEQHQLLDFQDALLVFIIVGTSLLMMAGLMATGFSEDDIHRRIEQKEEGK